ncbi:sugar ABC transporter substrate-binding protein [Microbacterium sp. cx-55]|uniref:ABC transporter substrate-binding protein n=1 Tax=Microbacterium sp. cx-55 TaxID=2875948 RepID=UPI001CBD5E4B|nr:sugar ABC transporter substrate-binding protein [Microbacterium sp. cx-55]MBZ4487018.1 sugar ABC transporter substrate-binding protein [Microbacterium sp. cx-55]UGB35937.1 sugar ABC transporter substrate-binding protein [Microbacterium sp. cx-55]
MSATPRRARSWRPILVPAALAVAALTLASCAGGSASASGEGDVDELTVLLISSHEGASKLLAEEYEAKTGVKINPVIVPYDEIGNTLALDQQSGANTIDVAAPWYVSIGDLADAGAIQDLTDWIADTPSIDEADFIPSIYDPYTLVDGRRYGLPFDGDTHVLFYNKEILARNGFDAPPTTWDEYNEQSRTITANESADGVYGNVIFGQKSPLILGASFANRLAGFGGEFVDADGAPTINTPEAVAAAQSLADSIASAYPTPAETAFGEGNSAWYAGKVAFIENWTDLGVGSQINPDSTVADKWGVTFLPVGGDNTQPRASLVAGFTWVIAANTEKTEQAKDFIEWASSSEVNEELLVADPQTGIDPNRLSSLESEAYGDAYPALQEANRATLNGTLAWPTGKNATQAAEVLTDELAKLIAGEATAQEALDATQAEWEELLG